MTMKRMGVLGGISAQATIDFVWYHRDLPLRRDADGQMADAAVRFAIAT